MNGSVAVLFARADSIYKTIPGVDVWDRERDARKWPGGSPAIAHPPCRAWGTLKHMAKCEPGERGLAILSVNLIRKFGGILEHPKRSALWPFMALPMPGDAQDRWGGWTLAVRQFDFGHPAEKATLLYIVGVKPGELPPIPIVIGAAEKVVGTSGRRRDGSRKAHREISKAMREKTPPYLRSGSWPPPGGSTSDAVLLDEARRRNRGAHQCSTRAAKALQVLSARLRERGDAALRFRNRAWEDLRHANLFRVREARGRRQGSLPDSLRRTARERFDAFAESSETDDGKSAAGGSGGSENAF